MKILHIDSSLLGDASISRRLTASIVGALRQDAPGAGISYRDLAATPPSHLSGQVLQAMTSSQPEALTEAQRQERDLTDALLAEFLAADIVVIGAPMYNLNVPTDLKKWFDLVARARETFRYTESWPQGLVEGVRAVVVSSRGGIHQGETTDAVTPYLRAVLGLMGIQEVEFIYAEGLDNRPHGRDAGIASARAQIARLAVPA